MQREDAVAASSSLWLRPPVAADLRAVHELHADPRTSLFSPSGPITSLAMAQELLERWMAHWSEHGFGYWLVTDAGAPEQVLGIGGLIEKQLPEIRGLNLYYRFKPEAWGQGHATHVAERAIEFADEQLRRRDEVFARVRPDNLPSIRVLQRVGMICTGRVQAPAPATEPWLLYTLP